MLHQCSVYINYKKLKNIFNKAFKAPVVHRSIIIIYIENISDLQKKIKVNT